MTTGELIVLAIGVYMATRKQKSSALDNTPLVWPVRVVGRAGRGDSRVTQGFRPPDHKGVDICVGARGAPERTSVDADVLSVAAGRVARAARGERGWYVLIDSGDWAHSYLHLATCVVRPGQIVAAGTVLGKMGADPLDKQRIVHLHLQLAPHGEVTDPAPYLEKATTANA